MYLLDVVNRTTMGLQASMAYLHLSANSVVHYYGSKKFMHPKFSLCCKQGKVVLPSVKRPPKLLEDLFTMKDPRSADFMKEIRNYNNMFAFTSMGGKIDHTVNNDKGPYVYRLHGQNMYLLGDFSLDKGERDIIVENKSGLLQFINELHSLYLQMQYPWLFPYGTMSNIRTVPSKEIAIKNYVTLTKAVSNGQSSSSFIDEAKHDDEGYNKGNVVRQMQSKYSHFSVDVFAQNVTYV
ncbi:putative AT hook motif-containing protein [Senna tora]|uniref:Putative AT hook motif-containing protein n=1 Tax=Senna tora TaxID=362788 RepID=A0A834SZC9_9FABA|nr:putative AT hook motif-containing protein [Senna tora]